MKSRVLLAFVVACALFVSQLDAQDLREQDENNSSFKDGKNLESNKLTCFKCTSNNDPTDDYCYEINALTKTKQGCDYCQIKKIFSTDGQFSVKRSCLQSAPKNNNELNKWISSDSASVFVCKDRNLCNSVDLSRRDLLRLEEKSSLPNSSTALEASTTLKVESTSSSLASTSKAPIASSSLPSVSTAKPTEAPTRFFIVQVYNNCCSNGLGFTLFVICTTIILLACSTSWILCSSSCCTSTVETINGTHSGETRRRQRKAKKDNAKKSKTSQSDETVTVSMA